MDWTVYKTQFLLCVDSDIGMIFVMGGMGDSVLVGGVGLVVVAFVGWTVDGATVLQKPKEREKIEKKD